MAKWGLFQAVLIAEVLTNIIWHINRLKKKKQMIITIEEKN